ncbi:LuxR C-terminal-related transcriptional regulator [Allorhizobium sp. BGMRC 0089]|uniref:LuxR C-terminal-related transcriptional regulator n=1 Tax=Allorhizobium sonneratiae TaxID=2934936 RepID=UPI002033D3D3|nr:LuxR C-terminal-related transcriptional regulator [Allorhizobium sonneratiae]MCM2294091.1 LuxR C-terminal-related transcriptional regulator [Allorhizobium sonneratiae]
MTLNRRFQPPESAPHAIERRALVERLESFGLKRVTAIVAPAGYGKTSLAVQWYEHLKRLGLSLLWLSLDQEHGDQMAFLLLMLDGLASLQNESAGVLDVGSMTTASVLSVLSTRLRRWSEPLILFLDDYHFAQTDATETILAKLLADRSLEHVKLVLVSRTPPRFPVSSLRLREEYKQIGIEDLSFTDQEVAAFFQGREAGLSRDKIIELNRRTEGWAVALQMVRMLIAEKGDGDLLFSAFDGRNAEMGSYLSEQVFTNLPEDVQAFLIHTSPFPAFSRGLLEGVSECPAAGAMIAHLGEFALPVTYLGGDEGWIRYHPVFHSFLKEEAARRGLADRTVLQAAARWFEQREDFDAAVRHALLSGDANMAAAIVERAGGWRRVYKTTRGGTNLFNTILGNAASIELNRFPLTTLGLAVVNAKAGQLDAANHYMALAERSTIVGTGDYAEDLRVVRVLLALYFDRAANLEDLSALEHDLTGAACRELVHRALVLNMLSYNFLDRSELDRALHYGQRAIRTFRDGGADFGAMHLYTHIGQAFFFNGDCAQAEEAYDRLILETQTHIGRHTDLDAVGHVLKAELLAARCDCTLAQEALDWALPHLERHDAWFDLLAAGFCAEQIICRLKGDLDRADEVIGRMKFTARRRGFDRLSRLTDSGRARWLIETGAVDHGIRYAEAHGFARATAFDEKYNNFSVQLRGSTPALLWTRIYLGQGEIAKAREIYEWMMSLQASKPHVPRSIELVLLDIRLLAAENRESMMLSRLTDLMLTTPIEQYRALIWMENKDFLAKLRQAAQTLGSSGGLGSRLFRLMEPSKAGSVASATPEPSTVEILTDREQDVIALLSAGFSNKEIGRKLDLSDNTIKFHLRNIFVKLNVGTRTAAVTAARKAGLIS